MLKQGLQQKQIQKLSPQQIQTIKLLELPLMQLEQRIKREMEDNPVLEEEEPLDVAPIEEDEVDNGDEFSLEDYLNEEDATPSYRLASNNNRAKDDYAEYSTLANNSGLQQQLEEQLGFQYLDDRAHSIGLFIVGSIDDDGYLRRDLLSISDDLAFKLSLEVSVDELETVLKIIQQFEPIGVGARSLQECLMIQLQAKGQPSETSQKALLHAKAIVQHYFEEFGKKHYDKILAKMNISDEELRAASDEIVKLTPRPGNGYENMYTKQAQIVIPDFILEQKNEALELSLNSFTLPELKISKDYIQMISNLAGSEPGEKEKEAVTYVKHKVDSAKWFIDAIRQRQETLLSTMHSIMDFQKAYFQTGDESLMRPMILKDISEINGLDISTVSRVVNSKYIQTEWGVYPLRHFFSEGIQADSGEEVSTREVKRIIVECIAAENKQTPMTDEELMTVLKEKGYPIARRTVAKYRELLKIPVGRLRKEI